jgi:hypothetical protein
MSGDRELHYVSLLRSIGMPLCTNKPNNKMGMGIINSKPYITNSVIAEVVATMTIAIFN